jgi:hypothetical protein
MTMTTLKKVAGIVAVLVLFVAPSRARSGAMRPKYVVELTVTATEGRAHEYDSVVTVRDSTTRAIVAQPKLHSLEGQTAKTSSALRDPATKLNVTVEIGASGTKASYVVELLEHDAVATSYKAQVTLVNP